MGMLENGYSFPKFEGSTGGYLESAEREEKYIITWVGKAAEVFELPTGGAAIMSQGANLVYMARKEQCLALGKQLRTNFKIPKYHIFRMLPSSEIQFIHPKDGVFPEKVNAGRVPSNTRKYSIGKNPNPAALKFLGIPTYEFNIPTSE